MTELRDSFYAITNYSDDELMDAMITLYSHCCKKILYNKWQDPNSEINAIFDYCPICGEKLGYVPFEDNEPTDYITPLWNIYKFFAFCYIFIMVTIWSGPYVS